MIVFFQLGHFELIFILKKEDANRVDTPGLVPSAGNEFLSILAFDFFFCNFGIISTGFMASVTSNFFDDFMCAWNI